MLEKDVLRLVELRDKFPILKESEIKCVGITDTNVPLYRIGKIQEINGIFQSSDREFLEYIILCAQLANVLELGRKVDKPVNEKPG